MKKEFDVLVNSHHLENGNWKLTISLESEFLDSELPSDFKSEYIIDDEQKRKRFIEMVYNFLKNNLEKDA
jgi:hypothetical protein